MVNSIQLSSNGGLQAVLFSNNRTTAAAATHWTSYAIFLELI